MIRSEIGGTSVWREILSFEASGSIWSLTSTQTAPVQSTVGSVSSTPSDNVTHCNLCHRATAHTGSVSSEQSFTGLVNRKRAWNNIGWKLTLRREARYKKIQQFMRNQAVVLFCPWESSTACSHNLLSSQVCHHKPMLHNHHTPTVAALWFWFWISM